MNEYTILTLAKLAGVSTRTLRHYDALGLLKPARKNGAGYRVYGEAEVNKLQQILLHKACGMSLVTIKKVLSDPNFDVVSALKKQKEIALGQKGQLTEMISTIEKTIKTYLGETNMTDDQKFQGLKKQLITDNDHKYGEEVKQKWGEKTWSESNRRLMNMTQDQFERANSLDAEFKETLKKAYETKRPDGDLAQAAVNLHKEWLMIFWPDYSKEAHMGLAETYVNDERFHHYFGNSLELAIFFREAVGKIKD